MVAKMRVFQLNTSRERQERRYEFSSVFDRWNLPAFWSQKGRVMPRRFGTLLLVLAALCLFTGSALADSVVTMNFIGPGGNNAGGVYTYPYYFTINNSTTQVSLMCDSFDNSIVAGESWQANATSLLSAAYGHTGLFSNAVSVLFNPNSMLDYKAAGLIFLGVFNGTITNTNEANYAVWGLFSANARSNPYFLSSGALAMMQHYIALAKTEPNSVYKGLMLYTPTNGSNAQEFIGFGGIHAVPEPGSLMLMGTGLLLVYRRLRAIKL